ncbi:MAG: ABC transporter permease [Oscillochloridaceae bacterium umkhey_bin13]
MTTRFAPNPIIVRELRTRMRGIRPYLVLTIFLAAMALVGVGVYQLMQQQTRFGGTLLSAQVGQALFRGLAFAELFLVVVLAPAFTAGAISGEREQLTYDMLLATPLQVGQILWGKLLAALSYLFLLIIAAIPLFSVVLIFGGVEVTAVLQALVLLVLTAIFFGALGLTCSALVRRTAQATAVAYVLTLVLVGVPIVIASAWNQLAPMPGQSVPSALLYLNPFSALLSITTLEAGMSGDMMPAFGFGDPLSGLPLLGVLTPGVIYYGPWGTAVIPIYRASYLGFAIGTVLLGWFSAHLALPSRRWRLGWSDLGFALALAGLLGLALLTRSWWYIPAPQAPGGFG